MLLVAFENRFPSCFGAQACVLKAWRAFVIVMYPASWYGVYQNLLVIVMVSVVGG